MTWASGDAGSPGRFATAGAPRNGVRSMPWYTDEGAGSPHVKPWTPGRASPDRPATLLQVQAGEPLGTLAISASTRR
jgi:hypothetical protein